MKRIISFLLVILMVLSLLPQQSLAAEAEEFFTESIPSSEISGSKPAMLASNDTMASAKIISRESSISDTVGSGAVMVNGAYMYINDPIVYYKFGLGVPNNVAVTITSSSSNSSSMQVALLDVNGTVITSRFGSCNITRTLDSGVYYIRLNQSGSRTYYTLSLDYCPHDLLSTTTVLPTCTASGYTRYKCSRCDLSWTANETPASHKYGSWYYRAAPTCTQRGIERGTCSTCGATTDRYVDALGHSVSKWNITTAATCTVDGCESGICARCNVTTSRTISATGHAYGSWNTTLEPTCTESGTKVRNCNTCGDVDTQSIAAIGHTLVTDEAINPTCQPGLTEGQHCETCGLVTVAQEKITPINSHRYSSDFDPTCNSCGTSRNLGVTTPGDSVATAINATLGQRYEKTWNTSNCGGNYVLKFTIPEQGIVTADFSGFTADGSYFLYPQVSILNEYERLIWWHVEYGMNPYGEQFFCGLKAGTYYLCLEFPDGYDSGNWTYGDVSISCALSFTADPYCETESNAFHATANRIELEQTYTGYMENDSSSVEARADFYRFTTIPSHTYRIYIDDFENMSELYMDLNLWEGSDSLTDIFYYMTEGENGAYYYEFTGNYETVRYLEFYNMSGAQYRYSFRIVPVHKYSAEKTAATCIEQGYTTYTCLYCDHSYIGDYTELGNHNRVSIPAVSATCTQTGLTSGVKCSRCGETLVEQQTTPATGHTKEVLPEKAPSCAKTGLTEGSHCSKCGHIFVAQEEIPVTEAHYFEAGICFYCALPLSDYRLTVTTSVHPSLGYPELEWYLPNGLYQYKLYRADSENGPYALLDIGYGCCYEDNDSSPGKVYYYKIQASDDYGKLSAMSEPVMGIHPLYAPEPYITTEPSTGKIQLSWDSDYNAVAYQIYRSTKADREYTLLKTITDISTVRYTDTSAKGGITYYYKMRSLAEDKRCHSAFSEVEPCRCSLVQPVITLSITTSGRIKVSWDTVNAAESYEVFRATSKNGTYKSLTAGKRIAETSFVDTTAKLGTTYYYKVAAVSGEDSVFSAVKSRLCTLGQPQVNVVNSSTSGKNVVKWAKVEGAAKYQVYRATSKTGTFKLVKTTTATSYTDSSATVAKNYYYKVKAIHTDSDANSAFSKVVSRMCDLPTPVVKISGNTTTGKIKLSWSKITGAAKYCVYRATSKTGTYKLLKTTTSTSYTDTSAKAGTNYFYKVVALHSTSSANSAYSKIVNRVCDLAKPSAKITLNKGDPKVTWSKVEGASEYQVYRATSKSGTYKLLKTTTKTGFTDTKVKAGKTYYYKVRAVHTVSAATSAYSSVKYIKAK